MPTEPSTVAPSSAPTVNRKKQKRRQKQAARLAEEQNAAAAQSSVAPPITTNGGGQYDLSHLPISSRIRSYANGYNHHVPSYDPYPPQEGDEQYYTEDDHPLADEHYHYTNGYTADMGGPGNGQGSKAKRKKRGKSNPPLPGAPLGNQLSHSHHHAFAPPPPPPPSLPPGQLKPGSGISKERIWNTSTGEERERIKEYWLSLGEEERRGLVKIEKEAVLKKMKEQQKTSCSCTVCGRKRVAIEEELEVLYDAYYEELESYAEHQQVTSADGTPIMPPPRGYTSSIARAGTWNQKHLPDRHVQELYDQEDEDEEEYSDEEEDYSDEEPLNGNFGPASDFFNFGNSLTVQGGILTVADDLLKNDGKKFIDMMEQLAERRMQREEAASSAFGLGQTNVPGHVHGPEDDEDQFDDEDEEDDYDSAEDEDDGYNEEMEALTEEQRMEEGRRMFQIFAARMFEQRVLSAYKAKVAEERQRKLIEELDDESRLEKTREEKRAREAQKKKEKKRLQKQAKDEERQRKEAEKAEEEAARKLVEERKLEEQRQKKEEQRKKKEAEKKAQDEERQRKEAERQRKLQEARELQAEQERKQREQKEREKKKKEETRKKEREEREARERDEKEKEAKERELAERKQRETDEQKQREAKADAEKKPQDRRRKEEQGAKQNAKAAPATQPPLKNQASATNLHPPNRVTNSTKSSPHLPVAVPVVPKAPTPVRPPLAPVRDSFSSPKASPAVPLAHASPPPMGQPPPVSVNRVLSIDTQTQPRLPQSQYSVPFSPRTGMVGHPSQPPGLVGPTQGTSEYMSNVQYSAPPPGMPRMSMQEVPYNAQQAFGRHPYQNYGPPGSIGSASMGQTAVRQGQMPSSQAPIGPPSTARTNVHMGFSQHRENIPPHPRRTAHSRHSSATYDSLGINTPLTSSTTQPIARPAPIQRPSSVVPSQQKRSATSKDDVDDLSVHLGSSALLDDTDVPLTSSSQSRRNSMAPGEARRPNFNTFFASNHPAAQTNQIWGPPPTPSTASTLSTPLSAAFVGNRQPLPQQDLCDSARRLIGGICQTLSALTVNDSASHSGWHNITHIFQEYEKKRSQEPRVDPQQFIQICEMDTTESNGGGRFELHQSGGPSHLHPLHNVMIKFEPLPPNWTRGQTGSIRPPTTAGFQSPMMGMAPPGLSNVRGPR